VRRTKWVIGFLCLAAGFTLGQATPSLDQIVDGLQKAQADNHSNLRAYTVSREFRVLSGDHDEKTDSLVKATVSFVPPDKQTFVVDSATGNERGIAAVKRILESESELRDSGASAAFTRENYDFTFQGVGEESSRRCYILGLKPKHKERHLMNGRVWVDAQSYLPVKVDGELSKSPSWWVKQVHVTTDFANVKGMWLPTNTQAVADLRMFGRHTLMSQARGFNTAEQVAAVVAPAIRHDAADLPSPKIAPASARGPVKHRPTRPVLLGTGVLVQR
jgi:outer membrane lipoprotein-sorting protein